jgi:hypothetical protein
LHKGWFSQRLVPDKNGGLAILLRIRHIKDMDNLTPDQLRAIRAGIDAGLKDVQENRFADEVDEVTYLTDLRLRLRERRRATEAPRSS